MRTMASTSYTTYLPGGQHWSLRLRRGTTMRLSARETDTNVGLLCYNPENLLERLNLLNRGGFLVGHNTAGYRQIALVAP